VKFASPLLFVDELIVACGSPVLFAM